MKTVHSIERMSEEYEELLLEFDEAWKSNDPPELAEFTPEDAPASFLVELVRIDLERRITTNRNIAVETYLEQVPRLATIANILSSLSEYEHQLKERRERQYFPAIAGYRIEKELGRGGMGVVYLAKHEKLNRLVAIKIILSAEFVSVDARKRFLTEASTIAKIQHPQIIQIHDIGQYQNTPYFTLEYLPGGNLSAKLSGQPMEGKAAALLVAQLAEGVQAIHDHGIVHRDLKPANILFTLNGELKISDFGLAKVEDHQLTKSGDILGTPSYMAPEQASGNTRDICPQTDVYALGAILYECLTGRPPFQGATPFETLSQVTTLDPLPPRRWRPTLPVPLETICLKCLSKNAHHRYRSARELRDDLERFLNDHPIKARPISSWEKLVLWSRRHPELSRSLTALLIVILTSLGSVTYLWLKAHEESNAKSEALKLAQTLKVHSEEVADKAKNEAVKARKTSDILISVFEASDPLGMAGLTYPVPRSTGEELTARELLNRSASKVAEELKGQPEIEAAVRESIGKAYISLGLTQDAEPHITRSLQLRQELLGKNHPDTASSLFSMGWLRLQQGFMEEAEDHLREALAIFRTSNSDNEVQVATCIRHLGLLATVQGNYPEAHQLLETALAVFVRKSGDTSHDVLVTKIMLCLLYIDELEAYARGLPCEPNLGQLVKLFKDVINLLNTTQANRPLAQAIQLQMEALILLQGPNILGSYGRAENHLKKALSLLEGRLGQEHLYTAFTVWGLARVSELSGQPDNQERYFQKCIDILRKRQCLFQQKSIWIIHEYSLFLHERGRTADAKAVWAELFKEYQRAPRTPKTAHGYALHCYSLFLTHMRTEEPEFESVSRQAIELLSQSPRSDQYHHEIGTVKFYLARYLYRCERNPDEVMTLLDDSRSLLFKFYRRMNEDIAMIDELQGYCYERQGARGPAIRCYQQALEVYVKFHKKSSQRLCSTWTQMTRCMLQAGDYRGVGEKYWEYAEHISREIDDQFRIAHILSKAAARMTEDTEEEAAQRRRAFVECMRLLKNCSNAKWLTRQRMDTAGFPREFREHPEFGRLYQSLP